METVTAAPQGVSHTCWGDNVYRYSTPMPPASVKTRDELVKEFGPLHAKHQILTLATLQQNTFKS
jgi:hypothetical protein